MSTVGLMEPDRLAEIRDRVKTSLIGRERELDLVLAALATGRDLVLEGPPGTSKSTLLRAITAEWGVPFVLVEGNADLTPAKLVGHHDPARVLREGYRPETFVEGPLLEAMRLGGFLYIEEFNRAPEDTVNTLLTAMAEREIAVPRLRTVVAAPDFRVIASMNPFDSIGTTRLSMGVHDRVCRLAIGYQDAESERAIVEMRAPLPGLNPELYERLSSDAVNLTRATRERDEIRHGSSVRGAIDLTLVAGQLLAMAGVASAHDDRYPEIVFDAMIVAMSGRIFLDETIDATPEQVLRRIWEDHFILAPAVAERGTHAVEADSPVLARTQRGTQLRPLRRQPKQLGEEPVLHDLAGGSGTVLDGGADGRGRPEGKEGGAGTGMTDERGTTQDALSDEIEPDPEVLRRAREIAERLSVPKPRRETATRCGTGELTSVPYRGGADEIDLDRTLEKLGETPVPQSEDIIVRDRVGARRAVVLLVDVSGSMRGERIRTAAATVGALASELARDDLAVVAFWSDAAMLAHLGERVSAQQLLETMVRIPARGLTNLSFPLEIAERELRGTQAEDARAVLLSDCVHNAGPDPRPAAARLPRLDVLLDMAGEHDPDLARELAHNGNGRLLTLSDYRQVAPALGDAFAA